jgi:hypothetical protein
MPRTTVDIDAPILKEIRRLQREQGLSMGRIISRLLAEALSRRGTDKRQEKPSLPWASQRLNALVDLEDREAVYAALDRDHD